MFSTLKRSFLPAVNKYMSSGFFRACIATIIMADGMHHVHHKSAYFPIDGRDYMSEFMKILKVIVTFCLF